MPYDEGTNLAIEKFNNFQLKLIKMLAMAMKIDPFNFIVQNTLAFIYLKYYANIYFF